MPPPCFYSTIRAITPNAQTHRLSICAFAEEEEDTGACGACGGGADCAVLLAASGAGTGALEASVVMRGREWSSLRLLEGAGRIYVPDADGSEVGGRLGPDGASGWAWSQRPGAGRTTWDSSRHCVRAAPPHAHFAAQARSLPCVGNPCSL